MQMTHWRGVREGHNRHTATSRHLPLKNTSIPSWLTTRTLIYVRPASEPNHCKAHPREHPTGPRCHSCLRRS